MINAKTEKKIRPKKAAGSSDITQMGSHHNWLDSLPFTSTPLNHLTDEQVEIFISNFIPQNDDLEKILEQVNDITSNPYYLFKHSVKDIKKKDNRPPQAPANESVKSASVTNADLMDAKVEEEIIAFKDRFDLYLRIANSAHKRDEAFFKRLKSSAPKTLALITRGPDFSLAHYLLTSYKTSGKSAEILNFIKFLLDLGVIDPQEENKYRVSPLKYAIEQKLPLARKLLEEYTVNAPTAYKENQLPHPTGATSSPVEVKEHKKNIYKHLATRTLQEISPNDLWLDCIARGDHLGLKSLSRIPGSDINAIDRTTGLTPFNFAISSFYEQKISYNFLIAILNLGVDLRKADSLGTTPLALAKLCGLKSLTTFLSKRLALQESQSAPQTSTPPQRVTNFFSGDKKQTTATSTKPTSLAPDSIVTVQNSTPGV